jgi:DNA-binding response OmpR family regulator
MAVVTARPGDHRAIRIGDLVVDPVRRSARMGAEPLVLTRREFDLLAYLAARRDRVVPRRELVIEVWRQSYAGAEQTVDVHLCWLRRKLGESGSTPRYLRTIRGSGVMLAAPDRT